MGLPVILTPQSQKDLQSIVAFIARDNPESARSFGNELIDKALSLTTFPQRGRVTPELNDSNVREIVHGPYRIIYEVLNENVYVLR
jgi:toxin ParE1/3/4